MPNLKQERTHGGIFQSAFINEKNNYSTILHKEGTDSLESDKKSQKALTVSCFEALI